MLMQKATGVAGGVRLELRTEGALLTVKIRRWVQTPAGCIDKVTYQERLNAVAIWSLI
ncbi:hypothetical protein OHD27_02790 [Escherichia coli]|nr:hypothetical protein [Escherichia coli]